MGKVKDDELLKVVRANSGVSISMNMDYNELFSLLVHLTETAAETIKVDYNTVLNDLKTVKEGN